MANLKDLKILTLFNNPLQGLDHGLKFLYSLKFLELGDNNSDYHTGARISEVTHNKIIHTIKNEKQEDEKILFETGLQAQNIYFLDKQVR